MKKLLVLTVLLFVGYACSNPTDSGNKSEESTEKSSIDDGKGIGPTTNVELNNPLDEDMVATGKSIYELKCAACHKLTDQRVVGPGWKGLTDLRKPEWIMNMTTNVEEMLAEDPVAKDLLKECLVRMPNQNLTVKDARDVLEFMYFNDGKYLPSN